MARTQRGTRVGQQAVLGTSSRVRRGKARERETARRSQEHRQRSRRSGHAVTPGGQGPTEDTARYTEC